MFVNSVTGEALKCLLECSAVLPEALLTWMAGTEQVVPQPVLYQFTSGVK